MKERLPISIEKLAEELDELSVWNIETLKQIIERINISEQDLQTYSFFDHPEHESYGRKLLWQNDLFKIIVMSWSPGDFTAIHDHGKTQWGCVYSMGNATHRLYEFHNNILKLVSDDDLLKGTVTGLRGNLIHMMGNEGEKEIMSLHIYGTSIPGIKNISYDSKVFCFDRQKTLFTQGSAFLSMPRELFYKTEELPQIDKTVKEDYNQLMAIRKKLKRNSLSSAG